MKRKIADKIGPKEAKYILKNYKGTSAMKLAKQLETEFGGFHTEGQVLRFFHEHNIRSGLTGRLEKGYASKRKGKPMSEWATPEHIEKFKMNSFKAGHKSREKKIGELVLRGKTGAVFRKIGDNEWVLEGRRAWEESNGPIPKGYKVLHIDRDKMNNNIENLTLVTDREIMEIGRVGLTNDIEINKTIINLSRLIVKGKKCKEIKSKQHSKQ